MADLARAMRFIYVVGAARADASPEQLARLRAEVVPLLRGYRQTGDEVPVREAIVSMMGEDWTPSARVG